LRLRDKTTRRYLNDFVIYGYTDTIPTSPSSRVLLSYFLLVFAQRKLEKEMTESYEDYERVRCYPVMSLVVVLRLKEPFLKFWEFKSW